MYFYILAYPILGAGLKYIDDAFDEKIFDRRIAMVLAPILGLLWAYTMVINQFSATILLAIMIGVLLRGKIDNHAHFLGMIFVLWVIPFIFSSLLWFPLVFIATAAFLDEFGNDLVDRHLSNPKQIGFPKQIMINFFDQRWMTKIAVLYVVILGVFPMYFFLAILLFDVAYFMVRFYSRRQRTPAIAVKT